MKDCEHCGQAYTPIRENQKYCNLKCNRRAQYKRDPNIRAGNVRRACVAVARRRVGNAEIIADAKLKGVCPCGRCDSDPDVLLFHHRDPAVKCFSIAWAVQHSVSEIRLREEISKCDIICANWHTKLHKAMKRSGLSHEAVSLVLDPSYKRQTRYTEKSRQKKGRVNRSTIDPSP
jgi:hypothetical protein